MPKRLQYLLLISSAIRMLIAVIPELGNDEVYYYLYALRIEPNYFDHPPGVGVLIRIFTLNLFLNQEFFIRLGPVVCSALGTFLVYKIGSELKNERTGWYAALLYTSGIYTSVIAGVFIIPDSPQVVFWLAGLWFMYQIVSQKSTRAWGAWFFFGVSCGLCILCKVHGIFLWGGLGLYILFFRRDLFLQPGLYAAAIITAIIVSPIILWNVQNDFITYRFHSDRVAVQESIFHFDYFLQTFMGQLLYNNPVNSILVFVALFQISKSNFLETHAVRFVLVNGLPLILIVTGMSLFNSMLPHWSGPGFMTMILLSAAFLDGRSSVNFPLVVSFGLVLVATTLAATLFLIQLYPGTFGDKSDKRTYGDGDFTLDIYGWREFGNDFKPWFESQVKDKVFRNEISIVSHKWFPAAHLDFYVASKLNKQIVGVGDVVDLHQYYWLNLRRPPLHKGDDALCILPSNNTIDIGRDYLTHFSSADSLHSFVSNRGGEPARYFTVYLLHDYLFNDELHQNVLSPKDH